MRSDEQLVVRSVIVRRMISALIVTLATAPVGKGLVVHKTMVAFGQPRGDQPRAKRLTNGSLDRA